MGPPAGMNAAASPSDIREDADGEPPAERRDPTPLRALRPPSPGKAKKKKKRKKGAETPEEASGPAAPRGLSHLTTSARQRLELALDESSPDHPIVDDHEEDALDAPAGVGQIPMGLGEMTYSARLRLELALDEESIPPPRVSSRASIMEVGAIPFDAAGVKIVRSLARWIGFCGLITLTTGALTGLSYLTGPGSVAHVVVGILASALSVWLLLASFHLHRSLRDRNRQKRIVEALGMLRSALLLKAILLFSGMVLGCFAFSIVASLSLLLL